MKITSKINFSNTWTLTKEESELSAIELIFEVDNTVKLIIDQIKFGFELIQDQKTVYQEIFPPSNSQYKILESNIVENLKLSVKPDTDYELRVWCIAGSKMFYESLEFKTKKPESPFESWVWNNGTWSPPANAPLDGKYYGWNESTQEWIEIN